MTLKTASLLLCLSTFAMADVNPFGRERTDKLTVTSSDGTATLTVSLERIDREKIRRVDKGIGKPPEAWSGNRRLPVDILGHRGTIISSFDLMIDGKKIPVPPRFWNDIGGLELEKVIVNKEPEDDETGWLYHEFTLNSERPHISRSTHGGTVLITWVRPEE